MKKDEEILASAIAGGLVGAALGTLISDKTKKGEGAILGAIAGAALLGSLKAKEKAQQTDLPLVVEEEHALYEVYADGTKKFLKELPFNGKNNIPKRFTLK